MNVICFSNSVCGRVVCFVCAGALLAGGAPAATRTWTGGHSSAYWGAPQNWAENQAPDSGDDLVFPSGAARLINTNNLASRVFRSITISGDGYTMRGMGTAKSVGLTDGISSTAAGTSNTIELNLIAAANQLLECDYAASTLYINGDVNLAGYDLAANGNGQVRVRGVIEGSGDLSKYGNGTLWLEGSSPNTYTGRTFVNIGTLMLNKTSVEAIANGQLHVGNGTGSANTAIVREAANYQIGTIPVFIDSDGWLDLDDYSDTVGDITFDGGRASSSTAGQLKLGGSVSTDPSSPTAVGSIEGRLDLGAGTTTFDINGTASTDLDISASISGGSLHKTGPGNIELSGSNTFTGILTVEDGWLRVEHNNALGGLVGGTVIKNDAALMLGPVQIGNEPLTLNGDGDGWGALYHAAVGITNSWAGPVTLESNAEICIDLNPANVMVISGLVGGSGSLTKAGLGTLELSGSSGNTHGGDTYVKAGTLVMNKSLGNSVPHSLVISSSGLVATARHQSAGEIGTDVTINRFGTYDMNGYNETIRHLNLNGGSDIDTGSGTLTMSGNVNVDPQDLPGTTSLVDGKLTLIGTCTLSVPQSPADSGNPQELEIGAVIAGSGNIIKAGNGELMLKAANTFTGPFTLNEGALRLAHALGLGTAAGGTSINSNAYLQLHGGGYHIADEPLTLNSSYGGIYGALYSTSGSNVWAGPITLQADSPIAIGTSDGFLNLSGPIDGSGALKKINKGVLIFSGSTTNTYSGDTWVEEGGLFLNKTVSNVSIPGDLYIGDGLGGDGADVVRLMRSAQIGNGQISVSDSGLLDLNGFSETVGSVTGSGRIHLGSGGIFGVGQDGSSTIYSGLISGSGTLRKYGTGTLELTANNSWSGQATVYDGVLQVNGLQPNSGIYLYPSATLGGNGLVGSVESYGTVTPGLSAGEIETGNLVLEPGSTYHVELDGYTIPEYDRLDITGTVLLNSPELSVSLGFVPAKSDEFIIINNDGMDATSGSFNGLPEGASLTIDNTQFQISYGGGDGNDISLTVMNVTPSESLQITSISTVGGVVALEWEGGVPFYVVEKKTALTNGLWSAETSPTRSVSTNVPLADPSAFYRVTGGH